MGDRSTGSVRATFLLTVCLAFGSSQVWGAQCAKKFQAYPGHTACIDKVGKAETMALTPEEKEGIVTHHNALRRTVVPTATDMSMMDWDGELAMLAQKWADTCPLTGSNLHHDTVNTRFIPGRFSVGQNLGYGYDDFDGVTDAWFAEKDDYVYGTKYSSQTGMIGHYTQVVWAKSVKIGCGRTKCDGKVIMACNYGPAGNVGDFTEPYTSGTTKGSGCKTNANGICDCGGLVCLNGREMDMSTCTCDCGSRYITPDCSLKCDLDDPSYCGTHSNFQKSNCDSVFSPTVTSTCPKLCEMCPYAEKGYVEVDQSTPNPNPGPGPGPDGSTAAGPGPDRSDSTTASPDRDDTTTHGAASAISMCLSLVLASILTSLAMK